MKPNASSISFKHMKQKGMLVDALLNERKACQPK
jgi:hypothetical protein